MQPIFEKINASLRTLQILQMWLIIKNMFDNTCQCEMLSHLPQ